MTWLRTEQFLHSATKINGPINLSQGSRAFLGPVSRLMKKKRGSTEIRWMWRGGGTGSAGPRRQPAASRLQTEQKCRWKPCLCTDRFLNSTTRINRPVGKGHCVDSRPYRDRVDVEGERRGAAIQPLIPKLPTRQGKARLKIRGY